MTVDSKRTIFVNKILILSLIYLVSEDDHHKCTDEMLRKSLAMAATSARRALRPAARVTAARLRPAARLQVARWQVTRALSTDAGDGDALDEHRFMELADGTLHDILEWLDGIDEMLEESDISLAVGSRRMLLRWASC